MPVERDHGGLGRHVDDLARTALDHATAVIEPDTVMARELAPRFERYLALIGE